MSDVGWARGPGDAALVPGFDRLRSWKERPIDVRAEAAAQVGPQRRGEVVARRVAAWGQRRDATKNAEEHRCCRRGPAGAARATPADPRRLRTPEIRRRRRADPAYPSRWSLWRGEKGRAYVLAWEAYGWGLSERPKPWGEFEPEEIPRRSRLGLLNRGSL